MGGPTARMKTGALLIDGKPARTAIASVIAAGLVLAVACSSPLAVAAVNVTSPIVATAVAPHGGYWEVASNGNVYPFGGAKSYGSLPHEGVKIRTIVSISSTEDGDGYWLLSSTGTVYPFGDASQLGNAASHASAIIPDGAGYRVIYTDGKSKAFLPVNSGLPTGPPASLMPHSILNSNVQSWAVDPNSAAVVTNVVAQYHYAYGVVVVNFNRPVYEVPADQPMVPVSVSSGCKNFTVDTGTKAPIPSYAVPGDSSDKILTVYQPSSGRDWEFWEATDNGGSWSACWGGKLNMATSDGVFPRPYGETGSGISNLATEITEADVASGTIDHAIGIEVVGNQCDWDNKAANGGLYPADRTDCGYQIPGAPMEGQWFRFPTDMAMPSGLAPFAEMVFKAVQTYGMVVVDQGGAVGLEADQPIVWRAEGNHGTDPITTSLRGLAVYKVLADLPWSSLQVVDPPQA
ncbi:MAG TPA: hypothetical protein VMS00_10085 [Acidimicrobiales bacterium]|nr:hypothetical protein [Acidimicrobiales bacterium]